MDKREQTIKSRISMRALETAGGVLLWGTLLGAVAAAWYVLFGLPSSWGLNHPARRSIVLLGFVAFAVGGYWIAVAQNLVWPGPPQREREGQGPLSYEESQQLRAFYTSFYQSRPPAQRKREDLFGLTVLLCTVVAAVVGAWFLATPTGLSTSWIVLWAVASLWLLGGLGTNYVKYRMNNPRFK